MTDFTLRDSRTLAEFKQFVDTHGGPNKELRSTTTSKEMFITVYEKDIGDTDKTKKSTIDERIATAHEGTLNFLKSKLLDDTHQNEVDRLYKNIKFAGSVETPSLSLLITKTIELRNDELIDAFKRDGSQFASIADDFGVYSDAQMADFEAILTDVVKSDARYSQSVLLPNQMRQLVQTVEARMDNNVAANEIEMRQFYPETVGSFFVQLENAPNNLTDIDKAGFKALLKEHIQEFGRGEVMTVREVNAVAQRAIETYNTQLESFEHELKTTLFSSANVTLANNDNFKLLDSNSQQLLVDNLKAHYMQTEMAGFKDVQLQRDELNQLAVQSLQEMKVHCDASKLAVTQFMTDASNPSFANLDNSAFSNNEALKNWLGVKLEQNVGLRNSTMTADDVKQAAQEIINNYNTHIGNGPTLINAERAAAILTDTNIVQHQDKPDKKCPVSDITTDDITAAKLEPKFEMEVDGKHIAMSEPYAYTDNRVGITAYVENDAGKFELRSFYLSNSRGEWQSPSHFANDTKPQFLGKGYGDNQKTSTVLPIAMQKALHSLTLAMPERTVDGDSTMVKYNPEGAADVRDVETEFSAGAKIFFGALQYRDNTSFVDQITTALSGKKLVDKYDEIALEIKAAGDYSFSRNDADGMEKAKLAYGKLTVPDNLKPDFSQPPSDIFDIRLSKEYPDGGKAFVYEVPTTKVDGQDVQLKYMFIYDNKTEKVFLAATEDTKGVMTDFAVRDRNFDTGFLGTGLVEYFDMIAEPSRPNPNLGRARVQVSNSSYQAVYNFHEYVPFLQDAKAAFVQATTNPVLDQ